MAEYIVKEYSDEMENRWDQLVMEESGGILSCRGRYQLRIREET